MFKVCQERGKCVSHDGGTRCSVTKYSKSALRGRKFTSHGDGTGVSVAEGSKSEKRGDMCVLMIAARGAL